MSRVGEEAAPPQAAVVSKRPLSRSAIRTKERDARKLAATMAATREAPVGTPAEAEMQRGGARGGVTEDGAGVARVELEGGQFAEESVGSAVVPARFNPTARLDGWTALACCSTSATSNTHLVDFLVEVLDVDPHRPIASRFSRYTPLHLAAARGADDTVRLLLTRYPEV